MIPLLFFVLMFAALAAMVWSGLQLLRPVENPLDDRLSELMATRRQNESRSARRRLGGGFLNSFLYVLELVPVSTAFSRKASNSSARAASATAKPSPGTRCSTSPSSSRS